MYWKNLSINYETQKSHKLLILGICGNIFATLLHDMGLRGPTKGYTQLTRQNDFSLT